MIWPYLHSSGVNLAPLDCKWAASPLIACPYIKRYDTHTYTYIYTCICIYIYIWSPPPRSYIFFSSTAIADRSLLPRSLPPLHPPPPPPGPPSPCTVPGALEFGAFFFLLHVCADIRLFLLFPALSTSSGCACCVHLAASACGGTAISTRAPSALPSHSSRYGPTHCGGPVSRSRWPGADCPLPSPPPPRFPAAAVGGNVALRCRVRGNSWLSALVKGALRSLARPTR